MQHQLYFMPIELNYNSSTLQSQSSLSIFIILKIYTLLQKLQNISAAWLEISGDQTSNLRTEEVKGLLPIFDTYLEKMSTSNDTVSQSMRHFTVFCPNMLLFCT